MSNINYLKKIIDKIIGDTYAIGKTEVDEIRQQNLEILGEITNHLFEQLWEIRNDNLDQYEHSRKINGQLADTYIKGLGDYYYDYFYKKFKVEKQEKLLKLYKELATLYRDRFDYTDSATEIKRLWRKIKELENDKK